MKKRYLVAAIIAGTCWVATLSAAFAHDTAGSLAVPLPEFKPGFDDLMTLLVQPRHIKLYYAGRDKNWELAAFELRELRASFRRAGQAIPTYRMQDVNKVVAVMAVPPMDRLEKAIAERDAAAFGAAYAALTVTCNACHKVMEHGFLVIKVPDGDIPSQYPDQDFRPQDVR